MPTADSAPSTSQVDPNPNLTLTLTLTKSQVDQPAVREALHVPSASNFFDGDNGAGMVYRSTEPDLRPFYQHVANSTALRVLVYNGDTDPAINSFVAQAQNPTNLTLTMRLPPQPHRPVSTPAPASRARLRDAPIFTREHLPFLLATPLSASPTC